MDFNQLGRRNLIDEQRDYVWGRLYERRKKRNFKGNQYTKVLGVNLTPSGSHATAKEIAEQAGVSEKTIRRAATVSGVPRGRSPLGRRMIKNEVFNHS